MSCKHFAGLRVCRYDLVHQGHNTDLYWDGKKQVNLLGGSNGWLPEILSDSWLYLAFDKSEAIESL